MNSMTIDFKYSWNHSQNIVNNLTPVQFVRLLVLKNLKVRSLKFIVDISKINFASLLASSQR